MRGCAYLTTPNVPYQLHMARTLWHNTYRGKVTNESGEFIAMLRIILGIPLDRSEVPENAPEVAPYLNVQVEEAALDADSLITFEAALSDLLLTQLQSELFRPEYCHFFYPSPAELLQTPSTGINQ